MQFISSFKNLILLFLVVILSNAAVKAQQNFFKPIDTNDARSSVQLPRAIKEGAVLSLDETEAKTYLRNAPMEFKNEGKTLPFDIVLPTGEVETFGLVESPMLAPNVAALYPEIKTYSGNGLKNKALIIRISVTSFGFNAILLNVEGTKTVYVEQCKADRDVYFSYFTDAVVPDYLSASICKVKEHPATEVHAQERGTTNNTGADLRTYRFGFCCTGEYTSAHGGTPASAYASLVDYISRMNAVFERDLSIRFSLVTNNTYCFPDSLTDGFSNYSTDLLSDQNVTKLNTLLGSANFDIGHVIGKSSATGEGIASNGACKTVTKANAATLEGAAPYGQPYFDHAFFHEVGHQFSMSHSFNSSLGACTTREQATSVEPGAGITLMSYAFTCGTDDYLAVHESGTEIVKFFHSINYTQAITYVETGSGSTCGTVTTTGNTPPTVTMPSTYTVPKSTPFELTGTATDPNGDALTYSWEGMSVGGIATPTAADLDDTAKPPFFRSYNPKTIGKRTFPLLDAILDGTNQRKGDKLPSIATTLDLRMTVRDNRAGGGGVSFGTMVVSIDGTKGPFLETTNLAGTYAPNSAQTITWSVNNTAGTTPNVKISLSSDGGLTFPYVLLASTPNDGTESVNLSNINTTTARIKVEAIGNIFFDISNADFTIAGPLPIVLTTFTGKKENNTNVLSWKTASETNNTGFEIERSQDGNRFEKIGSVKGNATTTQVQNYNFTDQRPLNATNYYRLKQLDFDSRFEYSNTVVLNNGKDKSIAVYPNPSTGIFTIVNENEGEKTYNVINAFGQKIIVNIEKNQLDLSNQPSGLYYLQMQNQAVKLVKK